MYYSVKPVLSPPIKRIPSSVRFWIPRRGFRIQGFGFRIFPANRNNLDFGFQYIVDSGFLKLCFGFQSPGFRIQQKTKFPDSRFHKQNFSGFQKPDSLIWSDVFSGHRIKPTSSIKRAVLTNPPPPPFYPYLLQLKPFSFFEGLTSIY